MDGDDVVYSQIYRGRLLTKHAFAHLTAIEGPLSREWYTHVNEEFTILHVPGCNRTLLDTASYDVVDTGCGQPVVAWAAVLGALGHDFLAPFVNISAAEFEQLRKYVSHSANPGEKDGIFVLQSRLDFVGNINSMRIARNVRVNVDFYMNFAPVYDMRRRSLDDDNRLYVQQAKQQLAL